MLSGPRLDAFSARLLAIHQKGKRAPSTGAVDDVLAVMAKEGAEVGPWAEVGAGVGAEVGAEVESWAGVGAEVEAEAPQTAPFSTGSKMTHLEVDGFNPEDDPEVDAAVRMHVEAQSVVNTGCAECGGKDKRESDVVAELRREVAEIKARLTALEENVEQMDLDLGPGFKAM